MPNFVRYQLRTTDVEGARLFYEAVIGGVGDGIVPLPAAAAARGAPAHWLGSIACELGAEGAAAQWVERGATRLGPPSPAASIVLRDPRGVIVGLTDPCGASKAGVVWHVLNTPEAELAGNDYGSRFGWSLSGSRSLADASSVHEISVGDRSMGAIADTAGRPHVHPHWLFFFGVESPERAAEEARARKGNVLPPFTTSSNAVAYVCEDPQGAIFGLMTR